MGYLPLLTNSTSFDAKIYAIQKQEVKPVEIMALGSSITLDDISSDVLTKNIPLSYYNFSAWGLEVNDINGIMAVYLPKYHPKYVIICSSIPDFRKPGNMESYGRYLNSNDFIKNHFTEYFYIRNYNPLLEIINRKKEYGEFKKTVLNFDQYGGISREKFGADTVLSNWVKDFSFPTPYTKMQYDELKRLTSNLKKRHIQLFFIQAPIEQSYMQAINNPEAIYKHFNVCKDIIEKGGGVYFNYYLPGVFADSLFVDPFHLSGKGAHILTNYLANDMRQHIKQ